VRVLIRIRRHGEFRGQHDRGSEEVLGLFIDALRSIFRKLIPYRPHDGGSFGRGSIENCVSLKFIKSRLAYMYGRRSYLRLMASLTRSYTYKGLLNGSLSVECLCECALANGKNDPS